MGATALCVQVLFGVLTVAFAYSRALWVSYALLVVSGAALMVVFSLFTSLVQLIAPNHMRGRVMSIYMVAFRGGMPLGSLVTGLAIDRIGAPAAIAVNGVLLSGGRALVSRPPRRARRRMTFDIAWRRTYLPKSRMHGSPVAGPQRRPPAPDDRPHPDSLGRRAGPGADLAARGARSPARREGEGAGAVRARQARIRASSGWRTRSS